MSQSFPAPPALEFAMTISINLGKAYFVRPTQYGSERAAVYLLDGTVEGPHIKGIVVPNSGGDFPWVRPDGVIDFDARYLLQTDDGANIYFQSRGYRWGTPEAMAKMARREPVADNLYYMRDGAKIRSAGGQVRLAESSRIRRARGKDPRRESHSLLQGFVSHEHTRTHDLRHGAHARRQLHRAAPRVVHRRPLAGGAIG